MFLKTALNSGVLPRDYYALSDWRISATEPGILTAGGRDLPKEGASGTARLATRPRIRLNAEPEAGRRLRRPQRIVIHRNDGSRIVSTIEITSPPNKDRRTNVRLLAQKIASYLEGGVHTLLIDVLPPTRHDAYGIAGAVWDYFGRQRYTPTADGPLTLAASRWTESGVEDQVEPTAVGRPLVPMPLYLTADLAVAAPLEETYTLAFPSIPTPYRAIMEGPAATTPA